MFSEYVVRAVVADHVSQLRQQAAADGLARSLRRASSSASSPTVPAVRRFRAPFLSRSRALSHGQAQPCGC